MMFGPNFPALEVEMNLQEQYVAMTSNVRESGGKRAAVTDHFHVLAFVHLRNHAPSSPSKASRHSDINEAVKHLQPTAQCSIEQRVALQDNRLIACEDIRDFAPVTGNFRYQL